MRQNVLTHEARDEVKNQTVIRYQKLFKRTYLNKVNKIKIATRVNNLNSTNFDYSYQHYYTHNN